MPFEIGTKSIYNDIGAQTVWVKSLSSRLDKRQATVQLTVHADGVPHTPPIIVFRGKGLRINSKEQQLWDKRVVVRFQENAWVDENISRQWVQSIWKQKTFDPRVLILDMHSAQKTPALLHALSLRNTIPAFIPAGYTSLIQPLDVALNKPFKNLVDAQYNNHFEANLDAWALGKISASGRRILMTSWIGAAWEIFCNDYKDAIKASFVKCGIALPIDGSQDGLINIRDLNNYSIPPWQSNSQLSNERLPTAPLTASIPPADILPSSPQLESDSECFTDATTSFSESDDDFNSHEDLGMDITNEQDAVPVVIGQQDVVPDAIVWQVRGRRGLRSQITLGEEII